MVHKPNYAWRSKIVGVAKSWIDTPYHHGAKVKGVGCDCFGLIRGIWEEIYSGPEPEQPPVYTRDWAEASGEEHMLAAADRWMQKVDVADMFSGDVIMFRYAEGFIAKHAGILIEDCRMIHAMDGRSVVNVYMGSWWKNRIAGVYSFLEPVELAARLQMYSTPPN